METKEEVKKVKAKTKEVTKKEEIVNVCDVEENKCADKPNDCMFYSTLTSIEEKKPDHKYKLLNISTRDYSNVERYLNEGWKLSGSPFIYMGTIWQAITL